jgi:4-amino-4-deoxy-L-arabinose transferase-like glycosyltransferase
MPNAKCDITTADIEAYRGKSSQRSSHRLNNRFRIPDWLFLLAVCGFFVFWKLSSFGLIGADEPRYAQVAREMLQRHDWITPTLGGNAWLEKPPLYYWQAMIAYRLFGVSDWAARLPSAFDALVLVLAVYWFLRRFRPGMELDGALMLATCAGVVGYARAASMDMALAATFSIAMLAWYAWFESSNRQYLAVFYAGIALGMLAKGPVAPFLAALLIALFAASQKSIAIVKRTLWLPCVALFCAIGLPWFILVQLRNPQFFRVFVLEHNLARFGTNLYHHPEPFWYHIPVSLLGWMPWTVLVIAGLIWSIRHTKSEDSDRLNTFLLIWIALVIVFFSISRSKLPGYVLPAIPVGAVLAAQWLQQRVSQKPSAVIAGVHALTAAVLIFPALMIQYFLLDRPAVWGRPAVVPLIATTAVALVIFVPLLKAGWRMLRVATLVPAIIVVALLVRLGAAPMDNALSARSVVDALSQYDPHHLPVAAFLVPRETEFGLAFYRNQVIPRYELGQVPDSEHMVVAAQGYPKGINKAAGRHAVFLGNFPAQKLDFFYVPGR